MFQTETNKKIKATKLKEIPTKSTTGNDRQESNSTKQNINVELLGKDPKKKKTNQKAVKVDLHSSPSSTQKNVTSAVPNPTQGKENKKGKKSKPEEDVKTEKVNEKKSKANKEEKSAAEQKQAPQENGALSKKAAARGKGLTQL